MAKSGHPNVTVQPSLFDMFYEEFLTQFMSASADPNEICKTVEEDPTKFQVPDSEDCQKFYY